jgi:CDP-paratose 2-epimerase
MVGRCCRTAALCEFIALCQEITGKKIPIASVPENRPSDLRLFIGDCTKLFARTAWRPKQDIRRIVRDIHAWVGEHSGALAKL